MALQMLELQAVGEDDKQKSQNEKIMAAWAKILSWKALLARKCFFEWFPPTKLAYDQIIIPPSTQLVRVCVVAN